ncbi:hypothetical protein BOTBODRAFT_49051 [Botryobasidium botryosum FD-172 SS1]|uniref:Uncharacterized protein n=1 Tax=Botryobasidium botryosum (strain FD-172 SS1) TaxID=930990 RepID=A0A067M610_BOTB1|nr:hypothetical protein BOTBODRAFT_49051 [Botryobasidium botryosum FD-172 SS1]
MRIPRLNLSTARVGNAGSESGWEVRIRIQQKEWQAGNAASSAHDLVVPQSRPSTINGSCRPPSNSPLCNRWDSPEKRSARYSAVHSGWQPRAIIIVGEAEAIGQILGIVPIIVASLPVAAGAERPTSEKMSGVQSILSGQYAPFKFTNGSGERCGRRIERGTLTRRTTAAEEG